MMQAILTLALVFSSDSEDWEHVEHCPSRESDGYTILGSSGIGEQEQVSQTQHPLPEAEDADLNVLLSMARVNDEYYRDEANAALVGYVLDEANAALVESVSYALPTNDQVKKLEAFAEKNGLDWKSGLDWFKEKKFQVGADLPQWDDSNKLLTTPTDPYWRPEWTSFRLPEGTDPVEIMKKFEEFPIAKILKRSPEKYAMKILMNHMGFSNLPMMKIRLYEESDGRILVDVQRRQGCVVHFNNIYDTILHQFPSAEKKALDFGALDFGAFNFGELPEEESTD